MHSHARTHAQRARFARATHMCVCVRLAAIRATFVVVERCKRHLSARSSSYFVSCQAELLPLTRAKCNTHARARTHTSRVSNVFGAAATLATERNDERCHTTTTSCQMKSRLLGCVCVSRSSNAHTKFIGNSRVAAQQVTTIMNALGSSVASCQTHTHAINYERKLVRVLRVVTNMLFVVWWLRVYCLRLRLQLCVCVCVIQFNCNRLALANAPPNAQTHSRATATMDTHAIGVHARKLIARLDWSSTHMFWANKTALFGWRAWNRDSQSDTND